MEEEFPKNNSSSDVVEVVTEDGYGEVNEVDNEIYGGIYGEDSEEETVNRTENEGYFGDSDDEVDTNNGSAYDVNYVESMDQAMGSTKKYNESVYRSYYNASDSSNESDGSSNSTMSSESDSESVEDVKIEAKVNWTKRFEDILLMPEDTEKYLALADLAKDFNAVAQGYGKIIISESSLPHDQKILKPVNIGGIAGGEKYIFQGILFKFALDVKLNEELWMYGGKKKNDEKAMKAASHEKKGLTYLHHCNIPGFYCPLTQLIQFRGFCLTAMALLPIKGSDTICYGSNDAGLKVHAHPYVHKAMEYVSKILMLSEHTFRNETIIGPVDIEIHAEKGKKPGKPGTKYYFVDCARVFPPEYKHKSDYPRCIYYNLLRPEFTCNYKKALCSDALSSFCEKSDMKDIARSVKEATNNLHSEVIPKFSGTLCIKPRSGKELIHDMHRSGINIRHLGRVRKCLILRGESLVEPATRIRHDTKVRGRKNILENMTRLVLNECVSRTIKNEIRKKLRKTMETVQIATDSPYLHAIYQYLQPVLYFKPKTPSEMAKIFFKPKIPSETIKEYYFISNFFIPQTMASFYAEFKVSFTNKYGGIGLVKYSDKDPDLLSNTSYSLVADGAMYQEGKPLFQSTAMQGEAIIGIFYCARAKALLFTKDGRTLGVTLRPDVGVYIPVVCSLELLESNFGEKPYLFDIMSFCEGLYYPSPNQPDDIDKKYDNFWKKSIKSKLLKRYPCALSSEEKLPSFNLRDSINLSMVIERVQELMGIKLARRVLDDIKEEKRTPFKISDIQSLKPIVSQLPLINFAEGVSSLLQLEKMGINDQAIEKEQLKEAEKLILSGVPSFQVPSHNYYLGNIYYQMSLRLEGKEKLDNLRTAEKYYQSNDKNLYRLFKFPDLDPKISKVYKKSLSEFFMKTRFQEGLVALNKEFVKQTQLKKKILTVFPIDPGFVHATNMMKLAFKQDGEEYFKCFMKKLRGEIHGCGSEIATQIFIQAQTLSDAAVSSGNKDLSFIMDLTFIIHKALSILIESQEEGIDKLLKEAAINFSYLLQNSPESIETYLLSMFDKGLLATDLIVLLELIPTVVGLNVAVENVIMILESKFDHVSLKLSNITPIARKTFQTSKVLQTMPILSKLLENVHKPQDQNARIALIEEMEKYLSRFVSDLRNISLLKSDVSKLMAEAHFLALFGQHLEIYAVSKEWLAAAQKIIEEKKYICAPFFLDMIHLEKGILSAYKKIPTQLETFRDIVEYHYANSKTIPVPNLLTKISNLKLTVDEVEGLLASPLQMHSKLSDILYKIIQNTPSDHLEYNDLLNVKKEMDSFVESKRRIIKESEYEREIVLLDSLIKESPIKIKTPIQKCIKHGLLAWAVIKSSDNRKKSRAEILSWRPCYLILLTDFLIVTKVKSKLKKETKNITLKELKSAGGTLVYTNHIEINSITEITSEESLGNLGIKLANGKNFYFKDSTKEWHPAISSQRHERRKDMF